MKTKIFYDSYAIIEYVNGNFSYERYFKEYEGVTTLYDVMEVFYIVLREEGEEKAKDVLDLLKPIIIYPTIEDAEKAMRFKLKHKEKKYSYADCLGYIMAKINKIKFLTGNEGFRNIKNVEFVK